jgi:catalase
MEDTKLAEELVNTLKRPDGSLDLRPVHSIGIGAKGHFVASQVAKDYCIAEHFQGHQVPVSVRFSNGSGSATEHDGWSDVRGFATRFHLKEDVATDLVTMTLPEFFAPTPEAFLEFAIAAQPVPVKRESAWRKFVGMLHLTPPMPDPYPGETISPNPGAIKFANEHRYSQLAVLQAASIGAPVSYARAAYHAVHTFIITGPDGTRRWVRFNWQPISGVLNTNPKAVPVDKYLQQELRDRLGREEHSRFSLMMSIGEVGDDFNDSTRPWPPHRVRVMMGTLTLESVAKDQSKDSEKLSFNPCLLTEGIETSDDPVLHIRKEAYKISSKQRGATPCPFSGK